jgi:CDP-6-deoxy-D-xylo-4-hexulose-3-dehydrase
MIPLVKNTISNSEIDLLADWLRGHPRLTKGELTLQFENKWSELIGCKHSAFVNSGSSANLLMLYSLLEFSTRVSARLNADPVRLQSIRPLC